MTCMNVCVDEVIGSIGVAVRVLQTFIFHFCTLLYIYTVAYQL